MSDTTNASGCYCLPAGANAQCVCKIAFAGPAPEAVPPERTPETTRSRWLEQARDVIRAATYLGTSEADEVAEYLWPVVAEARADLVRAATTGSPEGETEDERLAAAERLREFIRAHKNGGCRVVSLGAGCPCPLCDVDRLAALRSSAPAPGGATEDGVGLIAAERRRQVGVEGCTPEHDDTHDRGELAIAGACYAGLSAPALRGQSVSAVRPPFSWPWAASWWKPSDNPVRNLVRAGALIAAEIDRLRRAASPSPRHGTREDGPNG